jgi:hypothetical protein
MMGAKFVSPPLYSLKIWTGVLQLPLTGSLVWLMYDAARNAKGARGVGTKVEREGSEGSGYQGGEGRERGE